MVVEITMQMEIEDNFIDEIKKIEHHADYLLDLDSYPEIKSVFNVKVKEDN